MASILCALRTAAVRFPNFYDIQARSLLDGNLDVPRGSLGIEEFVVRGRSYMYFPPFPALLRMPVLVFTESLDGDLTALSMLLGWAVFAYATTRMIWMTRRRLRGHESVGRTEAALAAILVTSITGGSTMLFLASQPFVFHEAYVWSTALTLSVVVVLLDISERPTVGRIIVCGLLATATILTRAPAGWAMAATMIGIAVWIRISRPCERSKPLGQMLTGAAIFAVIVGASVNWAKFHHAYRFPIADQVWSQINPARQASLANNGGRLDGIQFVATTILTYFRPDGIRFVPYLPFATLPAHPPSAVGDVVLDQTYRTGSITAFMPLLLIAALWGVWGLVHWRRGDGLTPMRLVVAGSLLAALPVLGFSHITFRYTADFLPLLVIGSSVAFANAGRLLKRMTRRQRALSAAALGLLAAYGAVANLAVAVAEARVTARGDALVDFLVARYELNDRADDLVLEVAELPARGAADQIAIVGDCEAVYLGTGAEVDSWALVEQRGVAATLSRSGDARPGTAVVATFHGVHDRTLELEHGTDGRYRFEVVDQGFVAPGAWFDVEDGEIVVRIDADSGARVWTISTNVGFGTDHVLVEPSEEGTDLYVSVEPAEPGRADLTAIGLSASTSRGPVPELCEQLTPREQSAGALPAGTAEYQW